MRDKNFHAQELRNLLNHLVKIHNNNPEEERKNRDSQFGEFCRSLVSYIEKYLREENKAAIENFMAAALQLEEFIYSRADRGQFNLSLSRQIFLNFPEVSSFKSSEDFDFFLDAFAKSPEDANQKRRFAELKRRAALVIMGPADAGPAPLRIRVPDPERDEVAGALLARHSPVGGDGVMQHLNFVEVSDAETFNSDLKKELDFELFEKDHRAYIGDLRVEKFRNLGDFLRFSELAFGEDHVDVLQGCLGVGISLDGIFVEIQNERVAALALSHSVRALDQGLVEFVKLSGGAAAGASHETIELEGPRQFDERGYVPSRCAVDGENIGDFIGMANQVLRFGHELRKQLIKYEEILIELGSKEAGEDSRESLLVRKSACIEKFNRARADYVSIINHFVASADEWQLPFSIKDDFIREIEAFDQGVEDILGAQGQLYYYWLIEMLNGIEILNSESEYPALRRTSLLRATLEFLRDSDEVKQVAALEKLCSFDTLEFSSAHDVQSGSRSLQAAAFAPDNVLLSVDDLNRLDPLPKMPSSRANRRLPISFAEPHIATLFSVVPDEAISPDYPETAALALKQKFRKEFRLQELGLRPGKESSFAIVSSSDGLAASLAFLPAKLNSVLRRELELDDYLYQMHRIAESPESEFETGSLTGDVHITRGFMPKFALHVVQPSSHSLVGAQIKELVLNYFRAIESFNELCGGEEDERGLLLPIFPLFEQEVNGAEVKSYELGAYLAVIALMKFRAQWAFGDKYRKGMYIDLLPANGIGDSVKKQVESWLCAEWSNGLLYEILDELEHIDNRRGSSYSIKDIVVSLIGEWDAWFESEDEYKRIKARTGANLYVGYFDATQYCHYIRATNNVVAEARFKKLKVAWDSKPTASISEKVLSILKSYNNLSLWKHHRGRVNDFVEKMQRSDFPKTPEGIWKKLEELYELILDDFFHGDSSYTAQQLITGSFMSRYFLLKQELVALFPASSERSEEGESEVGRVSPDLLNEDLSLLPYGEGGQVSTLPTTNATSGASSHSPPRIGGEFVGAVGRPQRVQTVDHLSLFAGNTGLAFSGVGAGASPGGRRRNSEGAHHLFSRPSSRGEGDLDSPSRKLLTGEAVSVTARDLEGPRLLAADTQGSSHHREGRLGSRSSIT